jgi:hypothetical protein
MLKNGTICGIRAARKKPDIRTRDIRFHRSGSDQTLVHHGVSNFTETTNIGSEHVVARLAIFLGSVPAGFMD